MIVELARRHHGTHAKIAEISISGALTDYVAYDNPVAGQANPVVDEDRLLENLPSDFLPRTHDHVLLIVEDPKGGTATAVRAPKRFLRWSKYFDAFSLTLTRR